MRKELKHAILRKYVRGGINKCDKIADTNGGTSATYDIDLSQYDTVVLTLGSNNGNYASVSTPTALLNYKNVANCFAFNSSGSMVAKGQVDFPSKTIATSAAAYNAMLFGIKKINTI